MVFRRILPILALMLLLCACAPTQSDLPPLASQPTLPQFDQELTPRQQLDAAVRKTEAAQSFTLIYGQIQAQGEQVQEQLTVQQVAADPKGGYVSLLETATEKVFHSGGTCHRLDTTCDPAAYSQQPSDGEEIFDPVYAVIPRSGILDRFCDRRLMVSPSNDGSFTYQITDLTAQELYRLIHGELQQQIPQDYDRAIGTATVEVDPEGCLTQLRFDLMLPSAEDTPALTHTLLLKVEDMDATPQPQRPDWVTG